LRKFGILFTQRKKSIFIVIESGVVSFSIQNKEVDFVFFLFLCKSLSVYIPNDAMKKQKNNLNTKQNNSILNIFGKKSYWVFAAAVFFNILYKIYF
jgi:hypothetical protein